LQDARSWEQLQKEQGQEQMTLKLQTLSLLKLLMP
jgi:hypothetical protein